MYKSVTETYKNYNIMSALVLREFLYQLQCMKKSLLIHSDNIAGLNYLLTVQDLKGKIDLIYIDPPYATGGNFTITDGRASTIVIQKMVVLHIQIP